MSNVPNFTGGQCPSTYRITIGFVNVDTGINFTSEGDILGPVISIE
jgi:hypothetical protein